MVRRAGCGKRCRGAPRTSGAASGELVRDAPEKGNAARFSRPGEAAKICSGGSGSRRHDKPPAASRAFSQASGLC